MRQEDVGWRREGVIVDEYRMDMRMDMRGKVDDGKDGRKVRGGRWEERGKRMVHGMR